MSSLISPFGTDSNDMFSRTEITPQTVKRTRFGLKMPVVRQEKPPSPIIQTPSTPNSSNDSNFGTPNFNSRYNIPVGTVIPRISLDSTINELSSNIKSNIPSLEMIKDQMYLNENEKIPALMHDIQDLENRLLEIKNLHISSVIRPHKEFIKHLENDADQMLSNFDKINSPLRDRLTRLNTESSHLLDDFTTFQTFFRTSFNKVDQDRKSATSSIANTLLKLLKLEQGFESMANKVGDRNADFAKTKIQSENAMKDLVSVMNYSTTSVSVYLSKAIQDTSQAKAEAAEKLKTNLALLNNLSLKSVSTLKSSIDLLPKMFNENLESLTNSIQYSIDKVNEECESDTSSINLQIDDTFDVTSSTFNEISKEITDTVTKVKKIQEESTKIFTNSIEEEKKGRIQNHSDIKNNFINFRSKTNKELEENYTSIENWAKDTQNKCADQMESLLKDIETGVSNLHSNLPALDHIASHIADIEKAVQDANKYAMDKILSINAEYENLLSDFSSMREVYMANLNDFVNRVNNIHIHAKIEDAVNRKDVYDYVTNYESYIDSVFSGLESQLAILTSGADKILAGVDIDFKLNENIVGVDKPTPVFEGHSRVIDIKPQTPIELLEIEPEKPIIEEKEVENQENGENKDIISNNVEDSKSVKSEEEKNDVHEEEKQIVSPDTNESDYYSDYYYSDAENTSTSKIIEETPETHEETVQEKTEPEEKHIIPAEDDLYSESYYSDAEHTSTS
ncbi:hypothetical protein TVAG_204810 [Trichomonas vaginalis G3]|uniref:Uncharacterized protein n=1 Tax=Trichomonas vaginalis (strain ATCC PRA-98 / G3) TaxID=412133 RepID=A2EIY5_TRIV3|nr:hypothetical protein TVAGG3_0661550 [Trichomonas vaginalis G3]EAY07375.1 hypothetical protein TVAG_204810 [Trichomonas vaginalis G3]KAI5506528.1 hypothetical protein TVAGG3_0661550 [Trichomonas vaginalis G3]|eukprot:XP_001319598.1 hypothetical protein [Trichomonas vaginalis G3]